MISDRTHAAERDLLPPQEKTFLPWRFVLWLDRSLRPHLGWAALVCCIGLSALPAVALAENDWLNLGSIQTRLTFVGPVAVMLVWLLMGWRRAARARGSGVLRLVGGLLITLLAGLLVISQALVDWFPGVFDLAKTLFTGEWVALGQRMATDLAHLSTRYVLWWQGVQVGGATQDDLVFAGIAGVVFWFTGVLTAWLTRRYEQGLLGALPALWLLGAMLLYSSTTRGIMLMGLTLAVALHLLLDHHTMLRRWQEQEYDYSPGLVIDRLLVVVSIGVFILTLAALTPNASVRAVTARYYGLVDPLNALLEGFAERLFPDISGTSRRGRGGVLTGLPNEFLLGSGPSLGDAVVLRYRTNEAPEYAVAPYEDTPPPGHYMRGLTLTVYDGKGWQASPQVERRSLTADQSWTETPRRGRKLLTQSVFLEFTSQLLFAAPEPLEPGVDYRIETRAEGDLAAIWARERSYNVVSAIPAVDQPMLDAVGGWNADQPLPPAYAVHLDLPETVTERTRQLAGQLTAGLETQFQKAQAIETYLRGYEYDLSVPELPPDVVDVADYFLFDLQRGYCDYYATAFIVLARLNGLPARFASGYAVGQWDPTGGLWVVTEAEAHSWPEVYFPEYGWVPFEPTAGRPTLSRVAVPEVSYDVSGARPAAPPPIEEGGIRWNWQMLVWLAPLLLAIWGAYWLMHNRQLRHEDPWQGLLRWGRQIGRQMDAGETVLEYGRGLANYIVTHQVREPDSGRRVAREVSAMSEDVSEAHYAPAAQRASAAMRVIDRWQVLRTYLSRVKVK